MLTHDVGKDTFSEFGLGSGDGKFDFGVRKSGSPED